MLDDLIQTIETLKERIRKHKDYFWAYETRTRVSLIAPMLCALGWDVDDPDLVLVEPKTDKGWADYALLGINHRPVAFVEAKKLSENIAAHTQQTIGYAISENISTNASIRYCACTNGDDWKVFDLFTQAPVMDVSITGNDSAKAAMKFLGLWRRSFSDGSFDRAVEPLPGLVSPPVSPDPPEPVVTPLTGWTPLNGAFKPSYEFYPVAIRFPDGNEVKLDTWRSVLRETALWLYRSSLLTQEDCPIRFGSTRNLFSLDGVHANGVKVISPILVGDTGIIMEGDYTGKNLVKLANQLLQQFGQDPSKVLLRLP